MNKLNPINLLEQLIFGKIFDALTNPSKFKEKNKDDKKKNYN